jgi:hypothetical protein
MPELPPESEASDLNLDRLADGFAHIPAECGAGLAQASVVCLVRQGHSSGVRLRVDGSFQADFVVRWSFILTDAMRRFWNDLEVATENGAYGIALLLMQTLTGFTVLERSRKGSGFDWWLGKGDNLFQDKARLEVSGILRGDDGRINSRVADKQRQIGQPDSSEQAVYVVVVEFGAPRAKVVQS